MALIKTPKSMQPAFNEVEVVDDEATAITVTRIWPPIEGAAESVTLRRARINGAARFDVSGIVRRWFAPVRAAMRTQNDLGPWAFEEGALRNRWVLNNMPDGVAQFFSFNAVRQVGEDLDIYRSGYLQGEDPIITPVKSEDGRLVMPIYKGYPVGVCAVARSWYEPDMSDALWLTVQVASGQTLTFQTTGNGIVDWGEPIASPIEAFSGAMSHTFQSGGAYQIQIKAGTEATFATGATTGTTADSLAIRSVDQWGARFTRYQFQYSTNLTTLPSGPVNAEVNTLQAMFKGCSMLTNVPAGIFSQTLNATSAQEVFTLCNLAQIPDGLFSGLNKITSFSFALNGNPNLTSIPSNTFAGCTSATNVYGCLRDCKRLSSVPSRLFGDSPMISNWGALFAGDTTLSAVPEDALWLNDVTVIPKATDFTGIFNGCTALTAIPAGIFQYAVSATTMQNAFYNSGITSIPSGLFDTCTRITSFSNTFCGSKITSIPVDLFRYNTAVTNFQRVFLSCKGLTALPNKLFYYNTKASDFSWAFSGCSGLNSITDINMFPPAATNSVLNLQELFSACTSLPIFDADLFANCTKATNFRRVFYGCTALTVVGGIDSSDPENLSDIFAGCTAATSFEEAFANCTGLAAVSKYLFSLNINVNNFVRCFSGCSSLAIESPLTTPLLAPPMPNLKLWQRAGVGLFPAVIDGTDCFRNCTNVVDYANVPVNWGGSTSYYVGLNNAYRGFSATNTPLANFCTATGGATTAQINGVDVVKNTVQKIVFGDSYAAVTKLPDNFLRNFMRKVAASVVDLQVFTNVTEIGNSVFSGCGVFKDMFKGLDNVQTIGNYMCSEAYGTVVGSVDFTPFAKVTSIGPGFFLYCYSSVYDISPMVSLQSIGGQAFNGIGGLNDFQIGGLDFSLITTGGGFGSVANTSDCILRANSQELANAFKAKFPNTSNWTVVINQ